jgi:hypothetical protein
MRKTAVLGALLWCAAGASAAQRVVEPVAIPQSLPLSPSFTVAAQAAHPFTLVAPPDLGALDTREVRIRAEPPRLVPSFLPAPVAAWLEDRWRAGRERAIRAERMTTEELSNQETLVRTHALIKSGRPQPALDELTQAYDTNHARAWYAANRQFDGYSRTGMGYRAAIADGLWQDLTAAKGRSRDAALIAEARTARERVGAYWRMTAIQKKNSAHCGLHAWYNALSATVGFTRALGVDEFIAAARSALNGREAPVAEPSIAREFGLRSKPRDLGEGLDAAATRDLARWLGVGHSVLPPPESEAELLSLMRSGKVLLPSLRFIHKGAVAYHGVYLLGAFKSERLGHWIFMTQDSGSGTTDFYTFDELSHLTRELEVLSPRGPVVVPLS